MWEEIYKDVRRDLLNARNEMKAVGVKSGGKQKKKNKYLILPP